MGAGVLSGAQGREHGAAHGLFGGTLFRPDFPLSDALREKHLDARDGGDSFLRGELQELSPQRTVDQVHHDATVQLAGRERRNTIARMHADGSGIQDGVKRFAAQRPTRKDFTADGSGQFPRSLFPPRTNYNESASLRKSERRSSRSAARPKDQDAAPGQRKLFLEGTQNPDVISIAAEKRTISPDDHGVDGANLRCERVTLLHVLQDGLFM